MSSVRLRVLSLRRQSSFESATASLSLSHSLDAARERRIRDVRVRLDPYVMFGTYMYKYAGAREISNFTSPKVVRASLSSSRAPELTLCVLSFSMLILLPLTFLIHVQHVYNSIWTLYTRRVRILCVFSEGNLI